MLTAANVVGVLLCFGGFVSWIPQYISLIRSRQHKGIHELSLFVLNVGGAALVLNSLILNWHFFSCYQNHSMLWQCTAHLLPFYQILINWIVVFPLYLIFLHFKIRDSGLKWIYNLGYLIVYLAVVVVALSASLVEHDRGNWTFFKWFAWCLGVFASLSACVVWIPQIVRLIQTRQPGSLSFWMFVMQTPGSLIIVIFQAVLSHQNWTTWITYVVTFVQQLIVLTLLGVMRWGWIVPSTGNLLLEDENADDEK